MHKCIRPWIGALLLGVLASAFAQPAKVYRVALLEARPASENRANLAAFLEGLKDVGYSEDRNLAIDYRSVDGRSDRFEQVVKDVARAKPDVIVTRGTPAALAAKRSTSIPVVMVAIADPTADDIVASLARPGGHVTGFTTIVGELHGKRLELIKQLLPAARKIGYLNNTTNPNSIKQWKEMERRARALGLEPKVFDVSDSASVTRALDAAATERVGALLLSAESLLLANSGVIIDFAARHKIPVMYSAREFVDRGGLVSYGVNYPHLYYRAAGYVGKIFRGVKPADLSIEQPTKFELVISLKAATALGIAVPPELRLRADVIE